MPNMNRSCFVPGCKTGYMKTREENKKSGVKNNNLFKAKSQAQLLKWRAAIPRKDKIFDSHNVVCELHFQANEVIRYFETLLPGGVHRIKRERPLLVDDAVPSIFPNCPKYLSKTVRPRKPPPQRNVIANVAQEVGAEGPNVMPLHDDCPEDSAHSPENAANSGLMVLAEVAVQEGNAELLKERAKGVKLPGLHWGFVVVGNSIAFLCLGHDYSMERTVVIMEDLKVKVMYKGKAVPVAGVESVSSFDEIAEVLSIVDGLKTCKGASDVDGASPHCMGFTPINSTPVDNKHQGAAIRCTPCRTARRLIADRKRKKTPQKGIQKSAKKTLKICRIANKRLSNRVQLMKQEMQLLQKKCSSLSEESFSTLISSLPLCQQEGVRACFAASQVKNAKGRRYTLNWVYECILIHIKGSKVYNHLRTNNILSLPSPVTLNKYIRNVKGVYGFQEAIFHCMKEKSKGLHPGERRGTLLLDEMKLSTGLSFDKHTLKVEGFTDLGDHTPLHQKNERGDHALVLMFQPFRGRWVQALACFLSKGCASSTVLHHLILECIVLLEKSDFYVDVVTAGRSMNEMIVLDDVYGLFSYFRD